jgi:hypothetical protein
MVDACDSDLASLNWHYAAPSKSGPFYAARRIRTGNGPRVTVRLHRVIMERILGRLLAADEIVDHTNGNGLDNTRANLRLATTEQNNANTRAKCTNHSGFKGVYKVEGRNRWVAAITHKRQKIRLGTFDSPESAHRAYSEAARRLKGEFANDGSDAN